MKPMTVSLFVALVSLALLGACSAPQRDVYATGVSATHVVCAAELGRIANDAQDPEAARAAIRQYLDCRKIARTPEPPMEDAVREALARNPWTAIMRDPDRIAAHFFDPTALRRPPSYEGLDNWVQMLRDQRLVAEAAGDAELVAAIDDWIAKGEFALYVKNLGHKASK